MCKFVNPIIKNKQIIIFVCLKEWVLDHEFSIKKNIHRTSTSHFENHNLTINFELTIITHS